jgi:hypothetical protein
MTINEAKEVFINRGFVLTDDGNSTIYDPDKWRESVSVISRWLEHKKLEQEPCEDAISRDHFDTRVRSALTMTWGELTDDFTDGVCSVLELLKTEPSVQPKPKTGHCKDCKWWKDSDGVYRRGAGHRCPINTRVVFDGNGYCYKFEPQKSEG